ncbi:MAG: cobalamin biosynthesis protein CbiA [Deltaproteobacteria bacterium]|nr:cobalamin biosynthesis protein CbiA [Deltaproteobacteria bacterium]
MTGSQASGYTPSEHLVMIVGNYGSGKTEVAVNLALQLADAGNTIQIADLDIVNPYFRSREARTIMEQHGIRVVIPPGEQVYADLPIVLPEIKGMLEPTGGTYSLFDVGGDDAGARMLSSMREPLGDAPYALLQVINSRRPFTDTVDGCLKMQTSIEEASRLKVSGYIVNSHLIDQTTAEVVLEGYELANRVSVRTGVPVEFVSVMEDLAQLPEIKEIDVPVLHLERIMLPPWLLSGEKNDSASLESNDLPAARTKPIGKP